MSSKDEKPLAERLLEMLRKEKKELLQRIEGNEVHNGDRFTLNGGAAATEYMLQLYADFHLRTLQVRLAEIVTAIERLEHNPETAGVCSECGGPIVCERLEFLPWTTQCVSCAAKKERRI